MNEDTKKLTEARQIMDTLQGISNLLNTGLDRETLSICVSLCEQGVNPEALAAVIKELRRECLTPSSSSSSQAQPEPSATSFLQQEPTLRLDIKKQFQTRTQRVKAVDFHPVEPWLLTALYNGQVIIWNYESKAQLKTFEVSDQPIRAAKFIARKNWFVAGSDDLQIRVFNYNTHEKVVTFDGHVDYIRSIAVHPTQPYVLTSADDMLIKLWDWEKSWKNIQVFEGHTHYVMMVIFNPKDTNTFASASLDRTVKVWNLGSTIPNFTLEGHDKGVNCIDYYHGGDKPYLISGADDKLVKIWDYQNKSCVQTLDGHTQNVTVTLFHPQLPILISGGEDGSIRIWHANTYRLEQTLTHGFDRVWAAAYMTGVNDVAFGYDEGVITLKMGREEPSISMDTSGKIIWAKHSEIQTANIKAIDTSNIKDGERIQLPIKDLGSCEIYPQSLQHSPNGRFVYVCGNGEYIIYTALAWRNKSFGPAQEVVWSSDSNEYAVRDSNSKIKLFKNFKEKLTIKPNYVPEGIFGGSLLGVRSSSFLCLYDWDSGVMVRRIEGIPKNVYWSEAGSLFTIVYPDSFYVLKYNREAVQEAMSQGGNAIHPEEGLETALDVILELSDTVKEGHWVGDCFIYTTNPVGNASAGGRLSYLVGSETSVLTHFDRNMYLLGYIPKDNRIYLADKDLHVVSYGLQLIVLEYQTAILRQDFQTAESLLPDIPKDQRNRVARFLETQNQLELALNVSNDLDHRFDLALALKKLDLAYQLAEEFQTPLKWQQLGDFALSNWQFGLAEKCMKKGKDLEGLLLLYVSQGNTVEMLKLAQLSRDMGKTNITYMCYLLTGQVNDAVQLLASSNRSSEAAIMAKVYGPSLINGVLRRWKESFDTKKVKYAKALADPAVNPEMFTDYDTSLAAEKMLENSRQNKMAGQNYLNWKGLVDEDIIASIKERGLDSLSLHNANNDYDHVETQQDRLTSSHQKQDTKRIASPTLSNSSQGVSGMGGESTKRLGSTSPVTSPQSLSQKARPPSSLSASKGSMGLLGKNSLYANINDRPSENGDEDRLDTNSNLSHISMEVNTTGTESIRGDFDEIASLSGISGENTNDNIRPSNHENHNLDDDMDSFLNEK